MKIEEQANAPDIVEESSDGLGAPDSQDNWSPDQLSAADRTRYDTAVKAVDDFIANHPTYKSTDENREAILGYLSAHDLAISPASLELCWEQLKDQLDLEPEQRDSTAGADEQSDASARLATAGLARGNRSVESEEPPESDESEPEVPESGRRGKPVAAWRNGRAVIGVGS